MGHMIAYLSNDIVKIRIIESKRSRGDEGNKIFYIVRCPKVLGGPVIIKGYHIL
jgi:hypothetical protein